VVLVTSSQRARGRRPASGVVRAAGPSVRPFRVAPAGGADPETSAGVSRGRRELLGDLAYIELRDRIVTLRIPPRTPIDEDAIGAELGMGRTPVREAVKRLVLENLVTVFPRRGTFASEVNITDLAHISDVRAQLEGHAAYRAAERLTDQRRSELAQLLRELGSGQGSGDLEALMSLDTRVHRFIYRCADNPYLEQTLGRYLNLSLRIWYLVLDRLPHLLARVNELDDVLRAIADGEADRARAMLIEHISTFEREVRAVL
jgi:DNA-binding GntR family transcriptional regulator